MRYTLVTSIVRLVLPLIARINVTGWENVPPDTTSYIGVANHVGRIDPVIVYYLIKRNDIIMLVAEKYKEHLLTRVLAEAVDGIFVDRYNADLSAMREVFRRLKKGGAIALAPEGTRSPSASLIKGWDGASYIAAKAGLPILPIGATGTSDQEVVDRFKHLKRLDIQVNIGKTFSLPPLDNDRRDEQLAEYTEEIMCQIAALLPPSYRGIYADHPRLKQLLDEQVKNVSAPKEDKRTSVPTG